MDLYNVVAVAPNLGRLLEFQLEDLLAYFVGSEHQLAELAEYFELYTGHYRDYVRSYEQQRLNQVCLATARNPVRLSRTSRRYP